MDEKLKPVDAHTQEIRIATAMTGGVSLAIWMGGVARELNLLQQAAWSRHVADGAEFEPVDPPDADGKVRNLYVGLLGLLDITVSIDMLSGTSAGGINGALLGLARAKSLDLGPLREFWLESGSFEKLLRDPKERKPPSLLQGNGVLFKELLEGIRTLKTLDPPYKLPENLGVAGRSTKVFITTTLLTGETSRFTDSLGTLVQDVDRRGLFVFDEAALTNSEANHRVALAARCSASYPGAFEPGFVPFKEGVPAVGSKVPRHPPMERFANITRDHWVADGGLLANRPLGPLLQSVFDAPAERQVRRVLLYVVPTPGETPDPRDAPPDKESFDRPWTLDQALRKDLGSILGQSIRSDLTALSRHNDRVDSIRDTRLRIAEIAARHGAAGRLLTDTDGMLADYRTREAFWLVRPVIASLMRAVTTMPKDQMPPAWLDALAPGRSAEQDCREKAAEAVSTGWDLASRDDPAAFGRPAFDGAKATVLAMLRAAYTCSPQDWAALSVLTRRTHEAFVPGARPDTDLLVDRELTALQVTDGSRPALHEVAASLARSYEEKLREPVIAAHGSFRDGWARLAAIVVELRGLVDVSRPEPAVVNPFGRETAEERRRRAARELKSYLTFLPEDPQAVAAALLELHVATRSVLPVGMEVEQHVELIQVSADTRSVLAPGRATAADKLTGTQLHHFGAFYKPSWRANDWAWGRVDGAGWLVHMLLDPRRILALAEELTPIPVNARAGWFYGQLSALLLDGTHPQGWPVQRPREPEKLLTTEAVLEELAYLNDPDVPVPVSLPLTSLWVARRWQQWIAAHELPVIAQHMIATPATRHDPWARKVLMEAGGTDAVLVAAQVASRSAISRKWSREQRKLMRSSLHTAAAPAPAKAEALAERLDSCPVPDETLAQERGQPLFTRTVGKALATATAALTGAKEPPASVKPFFSSARTVTMTGYRATGLTSGSSWLLTLLGVIATVAGVVALRGDDAFLGFTAAVLLAVGLLLFCFAAWSLSRRVVLAFVAMAVTALVVIGATLRRHWLFGEAAEAPAPGGRGPGPEPGWVADHALPWLRDPVWHPLIALAGLVVLSVLINGGLGRLTRTALLPLKKLLRHLKHRG
ncbi:patatin-like protein [Streptomyces sp. NPDC048340]|uniref:patatin-like protein n=1 Tax=Streptomyces sp. NPDC048340 TaxID=3365537 RepID=UPI003723D6E9